MTAEEYVFPFEKLEIWHEAVGLAEFVLTLLEAVPAGRHLRLVGQMEAAASSPAQNIAEGKGRRHKKEFVQFLFIARGSIFEVVTLGEVFRRKGVLSDENAAELRKRCEALDRRLLGLVSHLRQRD